MRTVVITLLGGLLFICAGCGGGPRGVGNYDTVEAGILERGAAPGGGGIASLRDRGIRTIVDLRMGDTSAEHSEALAWGLSHFNIPCDAGKPSDEQMIGFLRIVLKRERQPVFVHCTYGKDRTGTAAAVYRIVVEHWDPERAIRELHEHEGFNAWFYPQIPQYLRKLDAADMLRRAKQTQ